MMVRKPKSSSTEAIPYCPIAKQTHNYPVIHCLRNQDLMPGSLTHMDAQWPLTLPCTHSEHKPHLTMLHDFHAAAGCCNLLCLPFLLIVVCTFSIFTGLGHVKPSSAFNNTKKLVSNLNNLLKTTDFTFFSLQMNKLWECLQDTAICFPVSQLNGVLCSYSHEWSNHHNKENRPKV